MVLQEFQSVGMLRNGTTLCIKYLRMRPYDNYYPMYGSCIMGQYMVYDTRHNSKSLARTPAGTLRNTFIADDSKTLFETLPDTPFRFEAVGLWG